MDVILDVYKNNGTSKLCNILQIKKYLLKVLKDEYINKYQ